MSERGIAFLGTAGIAVHGRSILGMKYFDFSLFRYFVDDVVLY